MNNQTTRVSTVPTKNEMQKNTQETDPLEALAQELGKEAGVRIGNALAQEIHEDPEVRRTAAAGAGIGVGVVLGLTLLTLATQ